MSLAGRQERTEKEPRKTGRKRMDTLDRMKSKIMYYDLFFSLFEL